jgi:hypothetical protein
MKRRTLNSLNLNKNSISNLNLLGGAAPASSNTNARTACISCTRSCLPCPITLADEDGCKKEA